VLRLLERELVFWVLAKPGFRRLGMMRTMAGGAGSRTVYASTGAPSVRLGVPGFESVAERWRGGTMGCSHPPCSSCVADAAAARALGHRSSSERQQRFAADHSDPSPRNRQIRVRMGFLEGLTGFCSKSGTRAAALELGRRGRHPHGRGIVSALGFTYLLSLGSVQQKVENSSGPWTRMRGALAMGLGLLAPPSKTRKR
jgi:hypothetical protein